MYICALAKIKISQIKYERTANDNETELQNENSKSGVFIVGEL